VGLCAGERVGAERLSVVCAWERDCVRGERGTSQGLPKRPFPLCLCQQVSPVAAQPACVCHAPWGQHSTEPLQTDPARRGSKQQQQKQQHKQLTTAATQKFEQPFMCMYLVSHTHVQSVMQVGTERKHSCLPSLCRKAHARTHTPTHTQGCTHPQTCALQLCSSMRPLIARGAHTAFCDTTNR
jgi:hypothetical protein